MTTIYNETFAVFFDRYYTSWTRRFATEAAAYLERLDVPERTVIDLCCGTGENTLALVDGGWRVIALDVSEGMIAVARRKLAQHVAAGRVVVMAADATDFRSGQPVGACVSFDGALNHMESVGQLTDCFRSIAASLMPGGQLVFDLFEPAHFRHWHNISIIDEPEAIVVKRGIWDDTRRRGMLRISGAVGEGSVFRRMRQTLVSRAFEREEVEQALRDAELEPRAADLDVGVCCPAANDPASPGRTIYRAQRPQRR